MFGSKLQLTMKFAEGAHNLLGIFALYDSQILDRFLE